MLIPTIIMLIQITAGSMTYDPVAETHQRFIQTFDQMMDITAKEAAHKSHQLQFAAPTLTSNDTLTIDETQEISNIFKRYLKDQMYIHSYQDIQDAATNRKGNYYVWDYREKVWFNQSSGLKLDNDLEAETANLDFLLKTLDQTYLNLLYPPQQNLEKRYVPLRQFISGAPNLIKSKTPKMLKAPHSATKPRNAGQPKAKTNLQSNSETHQEGMWTFTENGAFKPIVPGKKVHTRPFQQVSKDIQLAWKIYSHPLVKPFFVKSKTVKSASSKSNLKKIKSAWRAANHPALKPYFQQYIKLIKQQHLSLNSQMRKEAADELQYMRDMMKLGETILDTISHIFMIA